MISGLGPSGWGQVLSTLVIGAAVMLGVASIFTLVRSNRELADQMQVQSRAIAKLSIEVEAARSNQVMLHEIIERLDTTIRASAVPAK